MAKFSKSQLKKSLVNGLNLVEKDGVFEWTPFDGIKSFYDRGFRLFNDKKHNLWYSKRGKKK
jgi:hypothetical protein